MTPDLRTPWRPTDFRVLLWHDCNGGGKGPDRKESRAMYDAVAGCGHQLLDTAHGYTGGASGDPCWAKFHSL